jgi:hypothetical protein
MPQPRIHLPPRRANLRSLSRESVREAVGCPLCHVAPGERCLRFTRKEKQPVPRETNHRARIEEAMRHG